MQTDTPNVAGSQNWRQKVMPGHLIEPRPEFRDLFLMRRDEGLASLQFADLAIVGLARNCDGPLFANLHRVLQLAAHCKSWKLHIESNDNSDRTDEVLQAFCRQHVEGSFRSQTLHRKHRQAEYAGPRTIELAEYRTACQLWVKEHARQSRYVIVIDFDAWGGWTLDGLANSIGWLIDIQGSYGMASVSLAELDIPAHGQMWIHYDAWALRLNSYWDDYTQNEGAWKHTWLPPVGSEPVKVYSAFGGLCVYETEHYLAGTYAGEADCEHVAFHQSIAQATGEHLFINPSQRMVMHWVEDGGNNSHD